MTSKTKKATFSLHEDVLSAVDEAVDEGAAPSKNAFVERALLKELKELQRRRRLAQWEEAAKDLLLLRDLEETEDAFKTADAEATRRIS